METLFDRQDIARILVSLAFTMQSTGNGDAGFQTGYRAALTSLALAVGLRPSAVIPREEPAPPRLYGR